MLSTEQEAKERWCPLARDVAFEDNGVQAAAATFNRPWGADGYPARKSCQCIGLQCMAWRWSDETKEAQPDRSPDQHKAWLARRQGYCGAFGKP